MRSRTVLIGMVMALIFYCAAAFAQNTGGDKIGVINIQRILIESKAGKDAKAAFEKEIDTRRATLSGKEKSARAIEDELKSGGAKMKADVRKAKEEKLAEEIKELRRMKQDMDDDLRKKDSELTSKILKDVLDITKKVGNERGYSMVMQAGPQIIYSSKANDLTDEVLKRYDSGK